ncbi:MAG: putative drug exporter of the superfamily [Acidimicrobiaceae bacterium]|nr:putative drug exporter of the superfamily [Acidimicrobiaceae bacterium]
MLARLARSSYRHRRLVVLGWLVGLVLLTFVASSAGSAYSQIFRLSGTDSQAATDLLQTRFPSQAGSSADIVFKATAGAAGATGAAGAGIKDPVIQARLNTLFGDVGKLPQVGEVLSPFAAGGAGQISADGTIGYATVNLRVDRAAVSQSTKNQLQSLVRSANGPGLQVEGGGDPFTGNPAVGSTELIGLLAAVVILLIAFGSLLAMGLPILTALFGIGTGFAVVGLLSHLTSVPSFATQLAAMIGLGVGIDYALFIVTRYRQGLHAGLDPETAVVTALDTAGRAVVFAGSTVVISLLGMLLIGIAFIGGLGVGAAAVVAVTMLASVTLLPALLGFVGHTIDKLRIPGVGRQRDHRLTVGYRWGRFLQRHPWPFVVVGLVTLLALALPVLSIRLGSSDESNTPTTQTTRRAYDLKAQGFGAGASGPLILAAEISGSGDLPTLQKLTDALSATPGVAQAAPARLNPAGNTAVIQVIPTTSSQNQATVDLISHLRQQVIPSVTNGTDVKVHVGGVTASFDDIATKLQSRLPLFIGVVLALSFLLLLVVFRSLVVPAKAVIMNLLSIGAAYGVLVAVFQWGWGKNLIGVGNTGPIESFLPMMLFAILFGLSMDYEVFLLSRMREEYDTNGHDNREAVADGLAVTARVITAAAAIMVCVFSSFVFGDQRIIKEFGLGLAVAVLIDASIVRMILVPSAMELLGDANWWFPRWLSWLPKVHIDGNDLPALPKAAAADDSTPSDDWERQPEPVG